MAFKQWLKRFIGIKTDEDLEGEKSGIEKLKEFFESLLFAGLAAGSIAGTVSDRFSHLQQRITYLISCSVDPQARQI